MTTNLQTTLDLPPRESITGALVDVRYGQVGLVQVRVRTIDPGVLLDELTGRVAAAPHFFRRTGVCLDLAALPAAPSAAEVRGVIDALRRAGMLAIGLAGELAALEPLSAALNMPVLSQVRSAARLLPTVQPVAALAASAVPLPGAAPAAAPRASALEGPQLPAAESTERAVTATAPRAPALLHAQPVRSGQRVYARDRDLVVIAAVGAGAEVSADGCVHVYGALRGRAMAGAHGDTAARVFCQEFYAELVSIAGVFRVFETIPPELSGKPVQAWLAGEALCFERIGA